MSVTQTVSETNTQTLTANAQTEQNSLTLELPTQQQRGIRWASDTIDNEHLDRKSSKCCCIYKKPRAVGESSTSESDSDEDKNPYEKIKKKKKHSHHHNHDDSSKSSNQPANPPNSSPV